MFPPGRSFSSISSSTSIGKMISSNGLNRLNVSISIHWHVPVLELRGKPVPASVLKSPTSECGSEYNGSAAPTWCQLNWLWTGMWVWLDLSVLDFAVRTTGTNTASILCQSSPSPGHGQNYSMDKIVPLTRGTRTCRTFPVLLLDALVSFQV